MPGRFLTVVLCALPIAGCGTLRSLDSIDRSLADTSDSLEALEGAPSEMRALGERIARVEARLAALDALGVQLDEIAGLHDELGAVADLREPLTDVAELRASLAEVAELRDSLREVAELREALVRVSVLEAPLRDVAELEEPLYGVAGLKEPLVQVREPVVLLNESVGGVTALQTPLEDLAAVANMARAARPYWWLGGLAVFLLMLMPSLALASLARAVRISTSARVVTNGAGSAPRSS